MAKPRPTQCRLNEKNRGINFEVEIEDRNWEAFITFEALNSFYPDTDRIRAVSQSSYITGKVAECIRAGDVEPICLSNTMGPSLGGERDHVTLAYSPQPSP